MKLDCYNYPECKEKIGTCKIVKNTYKILNNNWDGFCKIDSVVHIKTDEIGTVLVNKNVYKISPPTENHPKIYILPNFWQKLNINFYNNWSFQKIIINILHWFSNFIKLFI